MVPQRHYLTTISLGLLFSNLLPPYPSSALILPVVIQALSFSQDGCQMDEEGEKKNQGEWSHTTCRLNG